MSNPGDQCDVGVQFGPSTVGSHSASLDVEDTSGTTSVYPVGERHHRWPGQRPQLDRVHAPALPVRQPAAGLPAAQSQRSSGRPGRLGDHHRARRRSFSIAWGTNCLNWVMWATTHAAWASPSTPPDPARSTPSSRSAPTPRTLRWSSRSARPRCPGRGWSSTPSRVAFGDVRVGRDASATLTLSNAGDYPLQSQGMLFITGRPDVFFSTDDTCTGRALGPGESCTVVVHFKPTSAGEKDAPRC